MKKIDVQLTEFKTFISLSAHTNALKFWWLFGKIFHNPEALLDVRVLKPWVKGSSNPTAQLWQNSAQNAQWKTAAPPCSEWAEFGYCSMWMTDIKRNCVSQFWWVNPLLFLDIANLNNHLQSSSCLANTEDFQEVSLLSIITSGTHGKSKFALVTGAFVCFQLYFKTSWTSQVHIWTLKPNTWFKVSNYFNFPKLYLILREAFIHFTDYTRLQKRKFCLF